MRLFALPFAFSFLFFCGILCAQSPKIDSLKNELGKKNSESEKLFLFNSLASELAYYNPDSAEHYAYKALELARKQKDKKQEAAALFHLGIAITKKGETQDAIKIYKEGLVIAQAADDKDLQGDIHRVMGVGYYHLSLYDSSLAEYFLALNIFKERKDDSKIAGVLNNIGNIYYFTKRNDAAETFYAQALEKYKELNDNAGLAKQYGNLGLIFIKKNDTLRAVEYSEKSLEYNLLAGSLPGIATSYVNLAYAYEISEQYDKALKSAQRALEIREQTGDKKGVAIATIMLGNIYYKKADYVKAIEFLEKGKELAEDLGLVVYRQETLEYLARSYLVTGRKKKAEQYFQMVAQIDDSLYNAKITDRIAEMETEYKTKEKDAQIQIQELTLKRRSTYLWGAAVAIVLLWIILGISYFAYKNKVKTNALLEKQNIEINRQKKEITDSINYAETIQRAILPKEKQLQNNLPESFVIFKPKDIVSGDFYWTFFSGNEEQVTKDKEKQHLSPVIYFAAVDCTGHGVPGAFMSIIGHNSLNRAVKDFKLTRPSEILDKLVELVTEALREENQGEVKDGMDIALCRFHKTEMRLEYAGAYNPLYLVRNNQLTEYKADRQPIGAFEKRKPFTNHEIVLQKGDCIYVFSDGFSDQFGGEKGKKLGSKRFKELLLSVAGLPVEQQFSRLQREFDNWKGEHEQTDDVTLIGCMV